MNGVTIFTSGSTQQPKRIRHTWDTINKLINKSIEEIQLTNTDVVLDVFPSNTIAHYVVTAQPAIKVGAELYTSNFEPFNYIKLFNEIKPTYISLIPRHVEILSKTKGWDTFDMSSVRYMVTGSQKVNQSTIDMLLSKGVQTVANWYGMTEAPPPVLIAYNSTKFDLSTTKDDYKITFEKFENNLAECYINGKPTGDLFDMNTIEFHSRKESANNMTWKNAV